MVSEIDIINEEANISNLQEQAKRLSLPKKTISYQHQNLRYGNRRTAQQSAISKNKKRSIYKAIETSQNNIVSLRELITKSLGGTK